MLRPISLLFCSAVSVVVSGALAGCPGEPAPTEVHLAGADAQVDVVLDPFTWVVRDGAGNKVLASVDTPAGRYGALTAGHDEWTERSGILSPGWDKYEEGVERWHAFTKATIVTSDRRNVTLRVVDDDGHGADVSFAVLGQRVRISTSVDQAERRRDRLDKVSLGFALDENGDDADDSDDLHFFGGGERFGPLDHNGECLYAWAEEGGLGLGEDTPVSSTNPSPNGRSMTYFPVPFFLTPGTATKPGFGAWLDTTRRTEACFGGEDAEKGRFTVNGGAFDVVVYVDDEPLDVLDLYTEDSGRPMVPAPWVWGPRRRVGIFSRVTSPALGIDNELEHEVLRRLHVPTTGMDDALHLLPARSEVGREEEILRWTSTAHDFGYKVMAYNNPYIASDRDSAAEDWTFGADNGLFLLEGDVPGETFFISGSPLNLSSIDLTTDAGVTWFQDLLRRSLALGYDGWMHDFGEYTEREWTAGNGMNGEELHNLYPVLSAKAAHDLLVVEKPDDFLFFVRSGYSGTQQYVPAVWGGDAESTFDESQGIPSAFRSGLSLALSGVPYWGSDTTGFKCLTNFPRDKEVYLRWAALSATSPIFMEQNACVGIDSPDKHTLYADLETVDVYAKMARLHTRLQPYFRVLAEEAHARGAPVLRHPLLLAPKDAAAVAVDDAWFVGDALYAAPVIRRGMFEKPVYFPRLRDHGDGRYVDLTTFGVHASGTTAVVATPLDVLPLFLTENRILPLLDDDVETLGDSPRDDVVDVNDRADVLDVTVALGVGGSAELVLADGTVLHAVAAADGAGAADDDLAALVDVDHDENAVAVGAVGDVGVLQLRGQQATSSTVSSNGVTVSHRGAPHDLLVRWTVLRL